ncbi:MAG: bifunctional 3,4-dihydroxy-2-butanone-4-phosphate synthase/GTP cyclohydrolase II [Flavobacteriales bacterium TMED288]|nr:bifunctional 3,4-dihydroxy-2-butanone-4-phosphate synthase/GTP cyclohydrolase II [Flavobacteriales bacterium]RPG52758.1 MAG: bifunctional 3,4-dihydroxy-2-butanone-4-phosphate synthase/GTP cyclohydrolase II [Flavobacteriales bacterium TMED288]|tara:strand:- start:651 stop:1853 length:1203 start_codon:yes stop_codon:yes gene_type:complete
MKNNLNTVKEALEDIKNGKIVIVVDDENRENEGDFVVAAEKVTPEIVNFMAKNGRGLICVPILEKRANELNLDMMVGKNTDPNKTQFTVSVDLIGDGCTTGISALDRYKTIKALIDKNTKPENLSRPGHIFPLKAKNGGVLRRTGHTEAAIDLARLAGLDPSGVIVEIMNEDGTMARLPELYQISKKYNLKIISIENLVAYRMRNESLIEKIESINLPTDFGDFKLTVFKQTNKNRYHLSLHKGVINSKNPILVRVHSSCVTGDIFNSCRCDCGKQLEKAMKMIEKEGTGIVVYMNQEGRGIGFLNKIKAYKLQEKGLDTVEANNKLGFKADERDYGIGAQILNYMGASKLRLMTNNPKKRAGLMGYGIEIIENIPLIIKNNKHNKFYLETKKKKLGHNL